MFNKQTKNVEIMSTKITQNQTLLMNQIIEFGCSTGFDFDSLTPESLDQLMKDWIESGRKFQQAVNDTEFSEIKRMLNL